LKLEEWADRYNDADWPKQRLLPIHIKSAADKNFEGVNIIWALGSMTKPIIPALIQLLQSPDREIAENAMNALPGAGTNAIPPLIELLNNPDKEVRLRAAITLGDFFRPKVPPNESNGSLIVTGSENFRSQARAAVPVLLSYLDSREINLIQRTRVIHALGLIREDAPVVVPILIHHIQSETNRMDEIIRGNYFWALGSFGTNAEVVVPFLIHILESNPAQPNSWDKEQALGNLLRINPEIAKPFLEKWKASLTNSINPLPVR
jgi:HEAT repeat protein